MLVEGLQLSAEGNAPGSRTVTPLSYPQFHDKIDQILESLERIVERLRQPPSISAEVEKIKEQIGENKSVSVDMEKLQPLYETLRQRGEEMIARSEGTEKDISAKGSAFGVRKQAQRPFVRLFLCLIGWLVFYIGSPST